MCSELCNVCATGSVHMKSQKLSGSSVARVNQRSLRSTCHPSRVFSATGMSLPLLPSHRARKLAYCGYTMRKQGSCLEKKIRHPRLRFVILMTDTWRVKRCMIIVIMQGTMPGARRRQRPRTAWMGNIKTWTGLSVEESIRMTEDRDKWRK